MKITQRHYESSGVFILFKNLFLFFETQLLFLRYISVRLTKQYFFESKRNHTANT
mgnify:FL=1